MTLMRHTSSLLALNVTRTRVTVLGFNLTIIALISVVKVAQPAANDKCRVRRAGRVSRPT